MLLLLAILAAVFWLPAPWSYVAIVGAGVVEAAELAGYVWYSKRRGTATGAEALAGATATVVERCRPLGRVRVVGELWRARCAEGAEVGEMVVVEALGPDLTLLVRRA